MYWFRTPPGVKVGRSALDEDAIRLIEANNPDVEFDWTRILKGDGPPPDVKPAPPRSQRQRPVIQAEPVQQSPDFEEPAIASEPSLPEEAAAVDVELADEPQRTEEPASSFDSPTAAQSRLGSEGISRLRARYAEVLARIDERVPDEAARTELKARAERLNPDTWVTSEEVRVGLEEYETVFASLRAVVGRRRRRRRRGGGRGAPPPQTAVGPAGAEEAETAPDEVGTDGDSEDDGGEG